MGVPIIPSNIFPRRSRTVGRGQIVGSGDIEFTTLSGPSPGINDDESLFSTVGGRGNQLPIPHHNSGNDQALVQWTEVSHVNSTERPGENGSADATPQSNISYCKWIKRFIDNPCTLFLVIISIVALVLASIAGFCGGDDEDCKLLCNLKQDDCVYVCDRGYGCETSKLCQVLQGWSLFVTTVVGGFGIIIGMRKDDNTNRKFDENEVLLDKLEEHAEELDKRTQKVEIETTISLLLNISSNAKLNQPVQEKSWKLASRIFKEYTNMEDNTTPDTLEEGQDFIQATFQDQLSHNECIITSA